MVDRVGLGWRVGRWLSIGIAGVTGFLVIAYVVLKVVPDWFAETTNLDAKGRADARQGVRTASLALLAGAIAVVGAIYTSRNFTLNRAGQITDRFTKAIEQLGRQEALDIRLGGIYALERIARDSKEDHPQVVEVLTAFIREHAQHVPGAYDNQKVRAENVDNGMYARLATDVQAVLTVLGRRRLAHDRAMMPVLDLSSTHLCGANLTKAGLAGSNLREAYLRRANLFAANLAEADLRGADLMEANLTEANLAEADLRGAKLEETTFAQANLFRANLAATDLGGMNLTGMNLAEADFRGTNLGGADLAEAILGGADLRKAILNGAIFTRAHLFQANLEGATLRGADLVKATLRGANLRKADLASANLAGADLSKGLSRPTVGRISTMSYGRVAGTNLAEANLAEANLAKANLFGASFAGANLRGANLGDTNLADANLEGANLEGTNLVNARYTLDTKWPKRFCPGPTGARLIEVVRPTI